MGFLALAGAISGAGQAAERGLSSFQSAVQQSGIDGEREKFDAARQQLIFKNESLRDDKRMQFEAGQNSQNRIHQETLHEKTEAGANTRNAASIAGAQQNTVLGHTLTNAGNRETQAAIDRRQTEELANRIQVARIAAEKGLETKLTPAQDVQVKYQMKKLEGLQEMLKSGNVDPKDVPSLKKEIEQIGTTIGGLVGVEPPVKPAAAPIAGDKWAGMLTPKSADAATSTPPPIAQAPAETFTVERTRPVMPRGSAAPGIISKIGKGQLDYDVQDALKELEHAKKHANAPRVKYLQQRYDALVKQQESGK